MEKISSIKAESATKEGFPNGISLSQRANLFISQNQGSVNPVYRQKYHAMSPIGWINDPNGFCYFEGKYHLFCQCYPYDSEWGTMHWAYWTSEDLVKWTWQGIAMAPDTQADSEGCFSGSAIIKEKQLFLLYTGVSPNPKGKGRIQQQCLAWRSEEGKLVKNDCPVITTDDLPEGCSPADFRDPKVYQYGNQYRAIIGSQKDKQGQLLLFSSTDLHHWACEGVFFDHLQTMPECPDYFVIDGSEYLVCSVILNKEEKSQFPNGRPVLVFKGRTERDGTRFVAESRSFMDYGVDFYAPQTIVAPDGRMLMIGWQQNWTHLMPTSYLGHGWNGCMSFPRELSVRDGRLLQAPVREIQRYYGVAKTYNLAIVNRQKIELPSACDMCIELHGMKKETKIRFFIQERDALSVTLSPDKGRMRVNYASAGYPVEDKKQPDPGYTETAVRITEGTIRLRVLLDICSAEIFVNDGEQVVSTRVFSKAPGKQIFMISAPQGCSGEITVHTIDLDRT